MEIEIILYIKIADFLIKIIFYKSLDSKQKNHLEREIQSFFKGFITKQKDKSVDYIIEIEDLTPSLKIQDIHGKKHYVLFYESVTTKKLKTFYTISVYQFQLLVQNIIYQLLSKSNGFLLHSSASLVDNKAYIFLGISGAGKSTSVRLLKNEFLPLSDDLSIIRRIKNTYFYYQHPFMETHNITVKNSSKLRVGKVFFLIKDLHFSIKKLSEVDKRCQIFIQQLFSPNKASLKEVMEFATKFNRIYEFHFVKNKRGMIKSIKETI